MASQSQIDRRGFLKFTGLAGLAALGSLYGNQPIVKALAESGQSRGAVAAMSPGGVLAASLAESWIASGCNGCVGWCPVKVRVVDGRAVRLTGNANSDWTKGKLCPKAHLNLQILYDPDRLKTPMKRTNPKKGRDEDPGWVAISWDEAWTSITAKLKELRDKGTPERLTLLRGRYDEASAAVLYSRFAAAYGTPNTFSHSALCAETTKGGRWMSMGDFDYSGYDWYHANYVISFGAPILESHRPVSGNLAAWGEMRRGGKARAKFVMVDPRYSVTAAKADEWISINPGTDAALALGMAHVILRDGLWDKTFVGDFDKNSPVKRFEPGKTIPEDFSATVEKEVEDPTTKAKQKVTETVTGKSFKEASTSGLLKWWNSYLKDFTPGIAAKDTGLAEDTIVRLAKELASAPPAIVVAGRGADAWPGSGTFNSYALMSLNALVGSIEKVVNHRPSVSYSEEAIKVEKDAIADSGTKKPKLDESKTKKFPNASVVTNNVADSILNEKPYPTEMIIAWWSNFAFSAPGSRRWEQVFEKVPFLVHHTTHISETSVFADILLPAKTYLEKWGYSHPAGTAGLSRGATLFQPVVEPLYSCVSELELGLELGNRLGRIYPSIKKSFDGIGGAFGDTAEGYVRSRTEAQWKPLKGGWDEFREKGTTNSYYKPKTEFATNSKKFEFYSDTLKATFDKLKMTSEDLDAILIKARGDLLYVPHYQPPIFYGSAESYPLILISYKTMLNQEGRSSNAPFAQEIYLPLHGEGWTSFAEINPETAARLGINDGDEVYVESQVGKIKTKAKLFPGIHPQVVAMAYGQGHFAYGRFAKNRGANPNEITGVMYDHITGMAAYYNTRVKTYKA